MKLTAVAEIVEEAGASLARSVRRYWPVNGRNELGERNQTMHLASAFLRREGTAGRKPTGMGPPIAASIF